MAGAIGAEMGVGEGEEGVVHQPSAGSGIWHGRGLTSKQAGLGLQDGKGWDKARFGE